MHWSVLSVKAPGCQSFRLPWAFFFPPLLAVQGLQACSNAEQLSCKFSVSIRVRCDNS